MDSRKRKPSRSIFSALSQSFSSLKQVKYPRNFENEAIGLSIVAAMTHSSETLEPSLHARSNSIVSSAKPLANFKESLKPLEFDDEIEKNCGGMFTIASSPPMHDEDLMGNNKNEDFLSNCNLCNKPLHGKNIFIYRGEKSFCSDECRDPYISSNDDDEEMELLT